MDRLSGFSFDQYVGMFDLRATSLVGPVLDLGSGFSTFNSECRLNGVEVLSFDPDYSLAPDLLKDKMTASIDNMVAHEVVVASADELRGQADKFYDDFQLDSARDRYCSNWGDIKAMPDFFFSYALAPYYFFNEVAGDIALQLDMIKTICRVATELRIFPIASKGNHALEEIGPMMLALQQCDYGLEVVSIASEQIGISGEMLCISPQLCEVKQL